MAEEPLISRVYDLKIDNFEDSIKKMEALTLAFKAADDQKKQLNESLKQKVESGDTSAIVELQKRIAQLEVSLKSLNKEREASAKEVALQAKADKDSAAASLARQKVIESEARTEKLLVDTLASKGRERDKQEKKDRKAAEDSNASADAAQAEEEVYRTLTQRIKELTTAREQSVVEGKPIDFEGEVVTLDQAATKIREMKVQQNLLNEAIKVGRGVTEETRLAEEGSLEILTRERKELELLIGARKIGSTETISFQGEVISLTEAQIKLKELIALEEQHKAVLGSDTAVLQQQISEYDKLVAKRKELFNLVASADTAGQSRVIFDGVNLSIQQGVDKVKAMKIEEQRLLDLFKIEKEVHDVNNIAEEGSLTILKAERAELKAIVDAKSQGNFNTVDFKGQVLSISEAENALKKYSETISVIEARQKTQKVAIDLVKGSQEELVSQTKILTASLIKLGEGLSSVQYNNIRASVSAIIPEFRQFTLEQARSGEAAEFLKQKIFANNVAIKDFQRSISGSNTLVGDYTKGIVDAFKNLGLEDVLNNQKNRIQEQLNTLLVKINELKNQYKALQGTGGEAFDKIDNELRESIGLHQKLSQSLSNISTSLNNTGSIGAEVTNGIARGFETVKNNISQVLFTYIGFQAAIAGVSKVISIDRQLTDQFADLQRILGSTKDETQGVMDKLRELDTRTNITELTGFATIAARAGVATDAIAGVASAINKLQLIAGSELGSIDVAITSIVKLINIFNGPGQVSEQTVLQFGNALVKLANEGVASGEFLVNFAERLSGIQGITKIGIKSVLGLGAAFEETGATSEIAATSISQVLLRVGIDVAKYAKLAGVPLEEFRTLLRENPGEALIKLAVGLKGNSVALDEFASHFGDLAAKGVRVTTIFGDLAANADFFRQKIALTGEALQDTSVILEGSEAKQKTFAATLDKISAQLSLAFSSPEFLKVLTAIGDGLLLIVGIIAGINFGFIATGIAIISAATLAWQVTTVRTALAQQYNNDQTLLGTVRLYAARLGILGAAEASRARAIATGQETAATYAARAADSARDVAIEKLILSEEAAILASKARIAGILTEAELTALDAAALEAHEIALLADAEATRLATAATTGFNTAVRFSPLGIIFSLIGLLLPLLSAFASKTDESTKSLVRQNNELKVTDQLNKEIAKNISEGADQISSRVRVLIAVLKDESTLEETRKIIYQNLIKISPTFIGTLDDEFRATERLTQATNDLVSSLELSARAKGFQTVREESVKNSAEASAAVFNLKVSIKEQEELIPKLEKAEKDINSNKESSILDIFDAAILRKVAQRKLSDLKESLTQAGKDEKDAIAHQTLVEEAITGEVIGLDKQLHSKILELVKVEDSLNQQGLKTEQIADKHKNILKLNGDIKQLQTLIANTTGLAAEQVPGAESNVITGDEKSLEQLKTELKILDNQIAEEVKKLSSYDQKSSQYAEELLKIKGLRKQREELKKEIKELGGVSTGTGLSPSTFQKDDLRDNEANRDKDLAIERLRFAKIEELNKATLAQEIETRENEQKINDQYDNFKIAAIQALINRNSILQKSASGDRLAQLREDRTKEDKELAETQLAIITRQLTLNDQIAALKKTQFDEEARIERKSFDNQKSDLELQLEILSNIPDVSAERIAIARKKADDQLLLDARITYDNLIEKAILYGQSTEALAEERSKVINDITKKGLDDNLKIVQAKLKDITTAEEKALVETQNKFAKYKAGVSNNPDLSENQIENRIKILTDQEANEIAAVAVAGALIRFDQIKKDYAEGKATLEQLQKAETEYLNAVQHYKDVVGTDTDTSTIFDKVKHGLSGLAETLSKKAHLSPFWTRAAKETFALAQDAMNSYFDAERNRVEQSKQYTQERLDLELSQLKGRAQSQAEEDTLDREFREKKIKADKAAGEQLKKIKKEEAKISLAIELANIAATAASNPLNPITFGAAGIGQYAVLAALAFARYALNISSINSTKFAFGGNPDQQTTRGGKVGGRSHDNGGNPFIFKGRMFEDEVDELNVIRTKGAPRGVKYALSGTQEQIASALNEIGGGIRFSPGAAIRKLAFGGQLNGFDNWNSSSAIIRLQAPVINLNNRDNDVAIAEVNSGLGLVVNMVSELSNNINQVSNQTNNRIDKIKVVNIAKDTIDTENNRKKASSIGTI